MKAIAIVGTKNSGKTGLCIKLAETLADMGHKVVAAKHTRHHFDKADTDTDKLRRVCSGVIGICPDETFVSWPGEKSLPDMLALMKADVLIVEGGKDLNYLPRVLTLKEDDDLKRLSPELALATFGRFEANGLPHLTDIKDLARLAMDKGFILPGLDCGACGFTECGGLAEKIVSGLAGIKDCKSLNSDISVTVGGAKAPMNPFVAGTFQAVIAAMLSQLKGLAPGKVKISMDYKGE